MKRILPAVLLLAACQENPEPMKEADWSTADFPGEPPDPNKPHYHCRPGSSSCGWITREEKAGINRRLKATDDYQIEPEPNYDVHGEDVDALAYEVETRERITREEAEAFVDLYMEKSAPPSESRYLPDPPTQPWTDTEHRPAEDRETLR